MFISNYRNLDLCWVVRSNDLGGRIEVLWDDLSLQDAHGTQCDLDYVLINDGELMVNAY